MKKLFLLTIFLTLALFHFGQITITSADMPQPGSSYEVYVSENVNGNFAATGANFTWDFSDLSGLIPNTINFNDNSNIPFTLAFAFGGSTMHTGLGNVELPEGIPVEDGFQFFTNNSDGYTIDGFGVTLSGFGVPFAYDVPELLFDFPLTYQHSYSSISNLEVDLPGIIFYSSQVIRESDVDGWGTLYLPNDTLNVLRVRTVINRVDSISSDSIGGVPPIPSSTMVYTWLAQGKGLPVLEITESDLLVTARFLFGNGTIGISSTTQTEDLRIYPNPGNELNLSMRLPLQSSLRIEIIDTQGRLLETLYAGKSDSDFFNQTFNLDNAYPSGLYFIRVAVDNEVFMKKWIKE